MKSRHTPLLTKHQVNLITFGFCVFLIVLAEFYLRTNVFPTLNGYPRNSHDFLTFYAASSLTLQHQVESIFDPSLLLVAEQAVIPSTKGIPWFYPPTYLLVIWPLALLDYTTSLMVFFCVTLLLFLLASHLWLRWTGGLFAVLAFAPVFSNLTFGQNGLLTAGLILLAIHHLHARPWLTGLLISMLLIKPHLGVLIPLALLCGRHGRVFLWATIFSACWIALSIHLFGLSPWLAFSGKIVAAAANLNEGKLLSSGMISLMVNLRQLGITQELAAWLHGLFALPFIWVMMRVWRISGSPHLKGASLGLATLVCSPYLFDYDLTWLALPIGLLALHASQTGWLRGESVILCIAWLLPLADLLLTLAGSKNWLPYNPWPLMNLTLLWLLYRRFRVHQTIQA